MSVSAGVVAARQSQLDQQHNRQASSSGGNPAQSQAAYLATLVTKLVRQELNKSGNQAQPQGKARAKSVKGKAAARSDKGKPGRSIASDKKKPTT